MTDLEARVLDKDFDASLQYLRRFVNGDPVDQHTVLRALALRYCDASGMEYDYVRSDVREAADAVLADAVNA